ncbi:MAG: extracytoplasmic sigma factor ECF [Gemmatimonadota bacterium]|nr:MAG: extracytoplasmic sigma factor ECF [Gemmatimonadota bacterium]
MHQNKKRQKSITEILQDSHDSGDEPVESALLPLVYNELRGLARAVFSASPSGHTLQPTALVHEAWLKLVGNLDSVKGRRHFFAVAATAMRQVLADHAKAHRRAKRGGGVRAITLHEDVDRGTRVFDVVAFDDALSTLSELNARHARVVELRFLGSLTISETAAELGISETTVVSDWTMARAWLRSQLAG